MKINITNKQYESIIKALEIAGFVYGDLSDFVDDKYKGDNKDFENTKEELLAHSNDYNFSRNVEIYDGKNTLKEKYYEKLLDDLLEYDEHQVFDILAHKLGRRDFRDKYSEAEIEKMSDEHHGYLGVPLYDFEKKYYDEFNENEYDRLFINDNKD